MPPIGRSLKYRTSLDQVRKHYIEKRRKCRISIISGAWSRNLSTKEFSQNYCLSFKSIFLKITYFAVLKLSYILSGLNLVQIKMVT